MRRLWPDPGPVDELAELYDSPGVRAGFVLSADGSIAVDGHSAGLSSPADKAGFRALRAVADVVLVGAGTARAEDYGPVQLPEPVRDWRVARGLAPVPRLAIVTGSGRLDPAARCFGGSPRTTVICPTSAALPDGLDADVLRAGDDAVDLALALRLLDAPRVLVEGGPGLLGDLLRAGLVDELCMTLAPVLAGAGPGMVAGALPEPAPLSLRHVLEQDGVLLLRYAVGEARHSSVRPGTA